MRLMHSCCCAKNFLLNEVGQELWKSCRYFHAFLEVGSHQEMLPSQSAEMPLVNIGFTELLSAFVMLFFYNGLLLLSE